MILTTHRWTAEEYERAGERGVFDPDLRMELIGGELVEKMSPQSSAHASAIRGVEEALRRAFPRRHDVRVQMPLALSVDSRPEPDVAVVTGSWRDYERDQPTTAVLVVEVSDSTLPVDLTTKGSLYASAGIQEYWVVNLPNRLLEVNRQPVPIAEQPFGYHYLSITRHRDSETIVPTAAPKRVVSVRDLFPMATR